MVKRGLTAAVHQREKKSKRYSWSRAENKVLLECYCSSNYSETGYMLKTWILLNPTSKLSKKQLRACVVSNISNRKLLSQLEMDKVPCASSAIQKCEHKWLDNESMSDRINCDYQ